MDATKDLSAALEAHGEALAAEMQALEDMPQVKLTPASVFDRAKPAGTKAQQRGVICQLRCCGGQLDRRCNDLTGDKACPTHVEAARMLRAKVVEKHGSEECAAKARQKLAEEGGEQTAFSVMMRAQLIHQRADFEMKQAENELQSLQSKVAAAERRLEEAQAEARRLGSLAKKPRTAESEWKSREYSTWDCVQYWRQDESRIYNARREKLSDKKKERPCTCVCMVYV